MALTLQGLFSVKRIASVSEIKLHAVYCENVNRNPGTYIITRFCREFIQECKQLIAVSVESILRSVQQSILTNPQKGKCVILNYELRLILHKCPFHLY